MINCRQCDFLIKGNMRHALINNCCPACGSAILGDAHTQRMKLFKQRLLQQEFAQSLSNDVIFDITLFMLLEFSPLNPEETNTASEDDSKAADKKSSEDDGSDDEGSYEKIRDEIREEVMSSSELPAEDIDEELKIARLKRLAKESRVNLSGTSVRRIGND